jgi:hypothetical protein
VEITACATAKWNKRFVRTGSRSSFCRCIALAVAHELVAVESRIVKAHGVHLGPMNCWADRVSTSSGSTSSWDWRINPQATTILAGKASRQNPRPEATSNVTVSRLQYKHCSNTDSSSPLRHRLWSTSWALPALIKRTPDPRLRRSKSKHQLEVPLEVPPKMDVATAYFPPQLDVAPISQLPSALLGLESLASTTLTDTVILMCAGLNCYFS